MLTRTGLAILAAVPALALVQLCLLVPVLLWLAGVLTITESSWLPWAAVATAAVIALADLGLIVWAIVAYVRHVRRNPSLSRSDRAVWTVALVLFAPLAAPIYWLTLEA